MYVKGTLRQKIEHNDLGGFLEITTILIDLDGNEVFKTQPQRIYPNATIELGPWGIVLEHPDYKLELLLSSAHDTTPFRPVDDALEMGSTLTGDTLFG